jgi:DNA modification methylase
MKPYYEHSDIQIFHGNALSVLRELPDESVNCCVTSPPYWGLRDYQTGEWEGGDPECDHQPVFSPRAERDENGYYGGRAIVDAQDRGTKAFKDKCGKCGAMRIDDQIGLEETPEEYVKHIVGVFSEVKRVLRTDGTLWLNLGDSYSGSGKGRNPDGTAHHAGFETNRKQSTSKGTLIGNVQGGIVPTGCKPKDLVGIPWMAAFALRRDGWYLRQDIIWAKPNPMPESVTDRCTKSHEYVFLLTKSARYYYNAVAIAEKALNAGKVVSLGEKSFSKGSANGLGIEPSGNGAKDEYQVVETRNKRSVWNIATEPFPDAHFATYPTDLVRPCILAGCPSGGTVLDPFGGAMTTMLVAEKVQCKGIAIELNAEYIEIGMRRLEQNVFNFEEGIAV